MPDTATGSRRESTETAYVELRPNLRSSGPKRARCPGRAASRQSACGSAERVHRPVGVNRRPRSSSRQRPDYPAHECAGAVHRAWLRRRQPQDGCSRKSPHKPGQPRPSQFRSCLPRPRREGGEPVHVRWISPGPGPDSIHCTNTRIAAFHRSFRTATNGSSSERGRARTGAGHTPPPQPWALTRKDSSIAIQLLKPCKQRHHHRTRLRARSGVGPCLSR